MIPIASDWREIFPIVLVAISLIALIRVIRTNPSGIEQNRHVLRRVEAKLDLLLRKEGLSYDPNADLPPGIMEALKAGKKIEAIKRYRIATGAGLAESKAAVEDMQRRAGL